MAPVLLCWFGLVGLIPADRTDPARAATTVGARLAPGPYFVGQAIRLDVIASDPTGWGEAAGAGVEVNAPRPALADLLPVDLDRSGRDAADPAVLARFWLVPRRSGVVAVPPFRVRSGDRTVASKPMSITVGAVAAGGRPGAFGGGVGSFRVASAVDPPTVRVGQPVEFRITMTGSAAPGSTAQPDLTAWDQLPPQFKIREATSELDRRDPPTRIFRYTIRPLKPGRATLPPVPLAAFDPGSRGYLTRYTPSLTLAVTPPPRFDPSRVDFGPALDRGDQVSPTRRISVLATGLGLAGAIGWGVAGVVRSRRRAARPVDWQREAARLDQAVAPLTDPERVAAEVAGRLAANLARNSDRGMSALTPAEAEMAVLELTRADELSRRAGRLVEWCDRLRFDLAANATAGDRGELVAEAVAVFEAIGRSARQNPDQTVPKIDPHLRPHS